MSTKLPEFLADIELAALPTAVGPKGASVNMNADVSTKGLDFPVQVCAFASSTSASVVLCERTNGSLTVDCGHSPKIPEVEAWAVSAALLALGDGNWKMGEGVQVGQKSKGNGADEGSENVVVEHSFVCLLSSI